MSRFTVDPANLDALANRLARCTDQVVRLHLPIADFAGWTGDPEVGELLFDFCQTIDNVIEPFIKDNIDLLVGALIKGANEYRASDQIVAVGPGSQGRP